MSSIATLVSTVVSEGGAAHSLPMPAISYGLMALVFFALLLGVTWAFRNNHQKSAPPSEHGHGGHGDHGAVDHRH